MKPGSRDHRHHLLISGDELRELQRHTGSMVEAFGLDRKIENYKGTRPLPLYRWDLDCLMDVIGLALRDERDTRIGLPLATWPLRVRDTRSVSHVPICQGAPSGAAVAAPLRVRDAHFRITRFSIKNSIIRELEIPEWPASGPTCRSKLFSARWKARISWREFEGWTLSSAVPK